jgi:hypothetical protein
MKDWVAVRDKTLGVFYVQHRRERDILLEVLQNTGVPPKSITEKYFKDEHEAKYWCEDMNDISKLLNEITNDGV